MGSATINFDDLIDAVARRMKEDGYKLVLKRSPCGSWTPGDPYLVVSEEQKEPILLRDAILNLLVERVAWDLPSENEPEDSVL